MGAPTTPAIPLGLQLRGTAKAIDLFMLRRQVAKMLLHLSLGHTRIAQVECIYIYTVYVNLAVHYSFISVPKWEQSGIVFRNI